VQKRRLGRTGLQVPIVGFGGTWIAQLSQEEASKVIRTAFDLGVRYFDTAKLDGDSEEKLGVALKGCRDECVIATKTGSRTKRESLQDVRESLARLQTDHLDIIQLHGIDDEATLAKATGEEGVLQTCKEARRAGLVNFIGITSHKPRVLIKAIETGEFDTVLVPLNVVTRQALEQLVPLAKELDVGVAVMKPFSAKTSKLITCLYQPSLSLLSDEPELHRMLGEDKNTMARSALRYVLSQDITVAIPGVQSVEEARVAAETGNEFAGLTEEEEARFIPRSQGEWCRDCGSCLPCPEGIDVAAVLRFHTLAERYGLRTWASKLYNGLEAKADKCTGCGACENRCPYDQPVTAMLKHAREDFKQP